MFQGVGRNSQQPSLISASSSAAAARLTAGRSAVSAAAAAGRRSSMSVRVSTASDPFATARRRPVGRPLVSVGSPLVPLGSPSGNLGLRRPQTRQPTRLGSRQTFQRAGQQRGGNPGYLVIPASALIQFLARRSRGGGFPSLYPRMMRMPARGAQPGFRGSIRPSRTRPFGLPAVGSVQGFGRVIEGAGPAYNIVPIRQPMSGGPPGYFTGGPGAGSQFSISSINSLNQPRASGQIANGNNIIIQDAGSTSGQQGGSIVIGANGGTITIRGFGSSAGGEQEEVEMEDIQKKTKNKPPGSSAKNSTAVEPIVLSTGGAKPQTIVIGGAGGTFTIGDKASGNGNATFILNTVTTPRTATQ